MFSNTEKLPSLENFLNSSNKAAWIYIDPFQIFVRKSNRYIDGKFYICLDLANISIKDFKLRGKGNFKKLIKLLKDNYSSQFEIIYIESIVNTNFLKHFNNPDNNWILTSQDEFEILFSPSFYQFLN